MDKPTTVCCRCIEKEEIRDTNHVESICEYEYIADELSDRFVYHVKWIKPAIHAYWESTGQVLADE